MSFGDGRTAIAIASFGRTGGAFSLVYEEGGTAFVIPDATLSGHAACSAEVVSSSLLAVSRIIVCDEFRPGLLGYPHQLFTHPPHDGVDLRTRYCGLAC
jgi:hypothetical protein